MLTDVMPARARKIAYRVYGGIGLALGAVPVYCGATATHVPTWVVGSLAVFSFIGAPLFGETAASNVDTTPKD